MVLCGVLVQQRMTRLREAAEAAQAQLGRLQQQVNANGLAVLPFVFVKWPTWVNASDEWHLLCTVHRINANVL